jgi:hypothetical protein
MNLREEDSEYEFKTETEEEKESVVAGSKEEKV